MRNYRKLVSSNNSEMVESNSRRSCGLIVSCYSRFKLMYRIVFPKPRSLLTFTSGGMSVLTLLILIMSVFIPWTHGSYRYTLDSCGDLTPKRSPDPPENFETYQPTPGWRTGVGGGRNSGSVRRTKRENYATESPSPVRITAPGRRYRRNSEVYVQVEAKQPYDSIMIQGRAVGQSGEFINGGVGLLGRFDPNRLDRYNFSYLDCFREQYATVLDKGFTRLGNITFIWTAPDADKGRIRFLAGVLKGINYWVIVSNILEFNPYPISTVQCGGAEACFRVCPLDSTDGLCGSYDSLLMYSYNTELLGKREVEFTLGGRLNAHSTYIAVAYAEDNDSLYQADVIACYIEHGRAKLEHYLLEVIGAPLLKHSEEIALDDYDFDGEMLWCRFRRPISFNHNSVIHPWKTFYILLFRGELNLQGYPKLQTPSRSNLYSSDQKYNLTTPINRIYSDGIRLSEFSMSCYHHVVIFTGLYSLWFTMFCY